MKIIQLDVESGKYLEVKELGALHPFSLTESFVYQLLENLKNLSHEVPQILVFSAEEKERILDILKLLVGGLHVDRGLGHGSGGEIHLFQMLVREVGLMVEHIPADLSVNQTFDQVEDWLLGVKYPAVY